MDGSKERVRKEGSQEGGRTSVRKEDRVVDDDVDDEDRICVMRMTSVPSHHFGLVSLNGWNFWKIIRMSVRAGSPLWMS